MEVYIIHIEFDAGNGNECAILDATMSKDMAKQLFQKHIKDYIDYWYNKELTNNDFVLKSISQENNHYTMVEYEGYEYYQNISLITQELV